MNQIVVEHVKTARQRKQFLELPWKIYRGDPNWIPPLRFDQKENVGYIHNPFYERNQIQTFLAYRGSEVVGRIGAILNQGHIERYDDQRGFFGFFESVDDQEVANGLFDAARDWFADQGIFKLRGPANPSLNTTVGLLIDGFDIPPTFMMTYNPPYYERLIENYGFRKTQDLYAFWGHVDMLPKIGREASSDRRADHRALQRQGSAVGHVAISGRGQDVPLDLQPLADEHVGLRAHVGRRNRAHGQGLEACSSCPNWPFWWRSTGGRWAPPSGCWTTTRGSRRSTAGFFPSASSTCLRNKSAIKRIRLISTNVLPEYQMHGLGMVLMHGLVPKALEWGIEEAEFSWVLESNSSLPRRLKKGGAKITKTYRVYDIDFDPAVVEPDSADSGGERRSEGGWKSAGRLAARSNAFLKVPWRFMPTIRSGFRR